MLTKEERDKIAERANECVEVCGSLYEVLLGYPSACNTTYEEDMKKLLARIVDLCDTSNMIELPLDKNGEVIHIHDVVYDNTGVEWEVNEFRFPFFGSCIYARTDDDYATFRPNELTHKKPVTIESLVARIKRVMNDDSTTVWAYDELDDIAEQLERLGDSDEA